MNSFEFSVLISIYRNESPSHFNMSLSSIWDKQLVKPSEIVIVKDGPLTVELEYVLKRWQKVLKDKLVVVSIAVNVGLGGALKIGLQKCRYELVARMDADDISMPHRFEKQLTYLRNHPEIDVLGSTANEINYHGVVFGLRKVPETHEEIVKCLWASPMVHPAIFFRRSKIFAAGNYREQCKRRQDYELWFRCVANGLRFHNLQEPLLYYRFGLNSHKKQNVVLAWKQGVVGYKGSKLIGLPMRYCFYCFIPFIRSIFPLKIQSYFYRFSMRFDPRRK